MCGLGSRGGHRARGRRRGRARGASSCRGRQRRGAQKLGDTVVRKEFPIRPRERGRRFVGTRLVLAPEAAGPLARRGRRGRDGRGRHAREHGDVERERAADEGVEGVVYIVCGGPQPDCVDGRRREPRPATSSHRHHSRPVQPSSPAHISQPQSSLCSVQSEHLLCVCQSSSRSQSVRGHRSEVRSRLLRWCAAVESRPRRWRKMGVLSRAPIGWPVARSRRPPAIS